MHIKKRINYKFDEENQVEINDEGTSDETRSI